MRPVSGAWRIMSVMVMGILLGTVLEGCAGRQRLPDWVGDPGTLRDASGYFVAVGEGPSVEAAEQDAKGQLLEQVREAVGDEHPDLDEYAHRVEQAGGQPRVTVDLLGLESIDAAGPLIGYEIVRRYVDERSGVRYAMGAISRALLVNAYETEMRLNSALADRLASQAEDEEVTLRRFTLLRTSLVAAEAYNALRARRGRLAGPLSGYDPSLDPPDESVSELREQIATLRSRVAASIESRGPDDVPIVIEAELKSALQRLNVPVRTQEGEGQVRIFVTYAVIPVNEHVDVARLVNWRLNVEVVEDGSGRSLATLVLDDKTGGKTLADARAEATRLARIALRERIDEFLNTTLFEQSLNQ